MPHAVVFPKSNVVEYKEISLGQVGPKQILMKTAVSLISTGTESRCFKGNYAPGTHWDNWIKYPFYPGYAAVGIVEDIGSEVTKFAVGDTVALRKGHATHHIQNESAFTHVPAGIEAERAVWLALAKICFMGNLASGCSQGCRMAILGAGPIGQMSVRWAKASGAEKILVIDMDNSRLDHAKAGGATATLCGPAGELTEKTAEYFGETGPEIVIDTTGNPAVFTAAQAIAGRFAKVVVLGDVGDPTQQHLTSDLIIKGLTIVGAHDCHSGGDWPQERIIELFFNHCMSGQIDMTGLNTHIFKPEQCKEAYKTASDPETPSMGLIFKFD